MAPPLPLAPLTFGTIRKNQAVVNEFIAPGLSADQRVKGAIAFLRLGWPEATEEDFDALPPGAIVAAAGALYQATFTTPSEGVTGTELPGIRYSSFPGHPTDAKV